MTIAVFRSANGMFIRRDALSAARNCPWLRNPLAASSIVMPAGSIPVTFAASCGCDLIFVAIGEVVVPPVVVPPVVVPPVVVPPVVVPPVVPPVVVPPVVPPVVVPPVVVPPVVVPPVVVPLVVVVRGDLPWVLVAVEVVVVLCDEPCVDGPCDVDLVVVGDFDVVVDFVAGPWLVVWVPGLWVFGAPDVVTRVGAGAWPCP